MARRPRPGHSRGRRSRGRVDKAQCFVSIMGSKLTKPPSMIDFGSCSCHQAVSAQLFERSLLLSRVLPTPPECQRSRLVVLDRAALEFVNDVLEVEFDPGRFQCIRRSRWLRKGNRVRFKVRSRMMLELWWRCRSVGGFAQCAGRQNLGTCQLYEDGDVVHRRRIYLGI